MKKYIIVLLILLLSTLCYAAIDTFEGETITDANNIEGCTTCDTIDGQVKKASVVSCTTPSTGDEMNEGFSTVTDETWATINGTPSFGATLPADAPAACCTEGGVGTDTKGVLLDGSAGHCSIVWDRESAIVTGTTDSRLVLYIYFDTLTLDNWQFAGIITVNESSVDPEVSYAYKVYIRNSNGTYQMRTESTVDSGYLTITTGVWYTIEIFNDADPAASSYLKVDAASEAFTPVSTGDTRYVHIGPYYAVGAGEQVKMYVAYTYLSTP